MFVQAFFDSSWVNLEADAVEIWLSLRAETEEYNLERRFFVLSSSSPSTHWNNKLLCSEGLMKDWIMEPERAINGRFFHIKWVAKTIINKYIHKLTKKL